MKMPTEINSDSFEIEDSADIMGLLKGLVDGHHPGILATVNEAGKPETRWMATLSFDEFPVFHTLTAPDSRKVAQIVRHPEVSWMFSNHELSVIMNLAGKARVLTDTPTLKRVWKAINDKSQAYFLNLYAKGAGFVVIETSIESIECTLPRNSMRFEVKGAELTRAHHPH